MDSLPDDINMNQLLMNHLMEIDTLRKASNVKRRCAVFQSIPREMRRRAASNNPKRRPKSIQWGVLPVKKKHNVKRHRKSRMKSKSRLAMHTPLHMWFTKRFTQQEKWGKLLPEHNNLKNRRLLFRTLFSGFSVFFMPHLKTFTIDLQTDNSFQDKLLETFKHFCSPDHYELIRKLSSMCEEMIHVYEKPETLLGPCRVTVIKSKDNPSVIEKCLITTHIHIYEKMYELFNESISTFGIIDHSDIFHIRIFGPNSQIAVKRRLFKREQAFPRAEQFGVIPVKADDIQSLTEESMLKQFFDNKDKMDKNVKSKESEAQVLLLKCSSKCDISTVHLMVRQSQLKVVWNGIVDNCNIRVGGWRDLKDLSLNHYLPVFPEIGYFDALKENDKPTVVGNVNEDKEDNEEVMDVDKKEWIYAGMEYEFGCPELSQGLYLLSDKCLKELNNRSNDVRLRQIPYEKLIEESGQSVGYVEFGGYSMREGKGIAIGRFTVNNWNRIVDNNKNNLVVVRKRKHNKEMQEEKKKEERNRMFVLAENACKQLYLVTVSQLVPVIDNPFNL